MKSDLHRHVGGAISAKVVHSLLDKSECPSEDEIRRRLSFCPGDTYAFDKFLDKFKTLEQIRWDEAKLRSALSQVCWDVVAERIGYAELKFSVDKYVMHMGKTPAEVTRLICSIIKEESDKWGVVIKPVLCLKYEADHSEQLEVVRVIDEDVVGLDLVGNEACIDFSFYKPIFRDWREAGKGLEAHVGESCSVDNVRRAIDELEVDRVAHGIRVVDDPGVLKMAVERNVCFDIAVTSNLCTGVVANVCEHPVRRMFDAGCKLTVGTDDPYVLQTTLDREYLLLRDHFGFSDNELMDLMQNSIDFAFADLSSFR